MKGPIPGALLLLSAVAPLAAADAPQPALTAEQVVERHVAARGGAERLNAITTLRLTGVYVHLNQELATEVLRKRPDRYLWVRRHGNARLTVGHDGQDLWWINPNRQSRGHWWVDPDLAKPAVRIGGNQARILSQLTAFESPLVEAREKGHTVTLAGSEPCSGRLCHKLEVRLRNGTRQTWLLDAQTFLEAAQTIHIEDGETKIDYTTYFLDHRPVDGVVLPHRLENEFEEDLRVLLVHKVELNVPLDDALFRMPPAPPAP